MRRTGVRTRLARGFLVTTLALGVVACAGPVPSPAATPAATSGSTSAGVPSPSGAGTSSGHGDASASPGLAASLAPVGGTILVDDALLALLPASIAGVPLTADPDTAEGLAGDPTLAIAAQGIGVATAFGPQASDGSADYVVATIVRLHPGTFSDGFFRDWRDSFDTAVCEQAGGVTGHAEAEIGGHPTWIGTCAGGVHTWHATLDDDGVIVSLQGAGPGRFGEQVIAGLTE